MPEAEAYREANPEQEEFRNAEPELDESGNALPEKYEELWQEGMHSTDTGRIHSVERTASGYYADWTDAYKEAREYLYGTEDTEPDEETAYEIMKEEAGKGNAYAMHDMGKIHAQGIFVEPDQEKAEEWYAKALTSMLSVEEEKDNTYLEYRIGKMYQYGLGTAEDLPEAAKWFTLAADKDVYAAYFLEHWNDMRHPDLLLMATRLMHHLERVIEDDVAGRRRSGSRQSHMGKKRQKENRLEMLKSSDRRSKEMR